MLGAGLISGPEVLGSRSNGRKLQRRKEEKMKKSGNQRQLLVQAKVSKNYKKPLNAHARTHARTQKKKKTLNL